MNIADRNYNNYVMKTYAPNITFVKGKGTYLWDCDGNKYLDFSSGIGVCNLGHSHPLVTDAVSEQVACLMHISNLYFNENQAMLAAQIAENSFKGLVFFANSGAEANEGMIKFARKWGEEQGKYEIICMKEAFHGRTLATLAATGRSKYRKGFGPDMQGFLHVDFNDIDAVKNAYSDKTAAVLIEPIQGEGGVILADKNYLLALKQLCEEKNILLLFDEVQCGMGRTGEYFAYQNYGIEPDAMSIAKALGNGFPIGAFEIQQKYSKVLTVGTHASTFGGSPLACAAGLAVFKAIKNENILENCKKMGNYLLKSLEKKLFKYSFVKEIRAKGLMIGIDIGKSPADVIVSARDKKLLILPAGDTVVRLLPALTVTLEEIDKAVDIIDTIFSKL